jgi:uncharacterized protein (DUF58 family)
MLSLERAVAGTSTDLSKPLEQVANTVRKRGLVVLISDLLAPTELLAARLGYLRSQGHEVVILRILDPAETDFAFDKPTTFVDMESGRDLYIDPAAARETYRRNFAEHDQRTRRLCAELGIDFYPLGTAQPLELALFDFLQSRLRTGARSTTARAASGGRSMARGGAGAATP